MKILVTGALGQLGSDVTTELLKRNHVCVGCDIQPVNQASSRKYDYREMDITNKMTVEQVISEVAPDAVIHCAAWTAVDAAENENNREIVMSINAKGTEYIASACRKIGAKLMYISTDYVFSGEGDTPWKPECEVFHPVNTYGESKLLGELAAKNLLDKLFIIRIAWVFGQNGNNFVKTMLKLGKTHEKVRVVCDQIGTPTYTPDLARLLVDMIETEKYGVYHATNEGGFISWYEFAREIFRIAKYSTVVEPVTTEEYGESKARRPKNSMLDKTKIVTSGFTPLPDWKDALMRYCIHT